MTIRRACGLVAALAATLPMAAAAQADVRADLVVANRSVWRGVNRVSGWVGQLQGSGSLRLGPGALGAGVYESRELFEAAAGNPTEVGLGRRGLGERNWWAEYRLAAGRLDLAAGATRYTFHGSGGLGGRASAGNTTEVYLLAEAQGTYLSPALAAHWDVDRVRGAYLEASGRLPLLGWPFPPEVFVYLDGALGLSLGEEAYYDGDGLTHAQLGLSVDVKRTRTVAFGSGLRFTAGIDDAARLGADGRERDLFVTFWLGATVGAGLPVK